MNSKLMLILVICFIAVHAQNTLECDFCTDAIKRFVNSLPKERSESEVQEAVNKACDDIPEFAAQLCKDFMGKHGPEIVQGIMNNEQPETICERMDICTQ
ncbi:Saposin-C [Pseudolycoriella hygida]|uniref:Saposin-C n=1 Tax=Pseudolycoriella hygida TaxID=35572 RepID=A0A9Q0NHH3_9DIPT|nr:Saposin-C [Pseudolycoriella hygida]